MPASRILKSQLSFIHGNWKAHLHVGWLQEIRCDVKFGKGRLAGDKFWNRFHMLDGKELSPSYLIISNLDSVHRLPVRVERTTAAPKGAGRNQDFGSSWCMALHVAQQRQQMVLLHLATSAKDAIHVSKGLIRRPESHLHFIPVYSSSSKSVDIIYLQEQISISFAK